MSMPRMSIALTVRYALQCLKSAGVVLFFSSGYVASQLEPTATTVILLCRSAEVST